MKFSYRIIAGFNLLPALCCGQQIVWQNHYGGDGYETTAPDNSEVLRNDSGYYFYAATTSSFGVFANQYAIKINDFGELVWQLNSGSVSEIDYPNASIKTRDDNYFMIGNANLQSINANDIRLTKFKDNGDIIFSKIILTDSLYPATANDICYTVDSNYIAACASFNNITLTKINNSGDTLWVSRPLPDSLGSGVVVRYQPAPDFSAYYGVSRHNNKYYWFKTNEFGLLLLLKEIRFPEYEWISGISKVMMLPNGNLLVNGTASFFGNPYCIDNVTFNAFGFLHEYNSTGDIIKSKYFCQSTDSVVDYQFSDIALGDSGILYLSTGNNIIKLNSDWEKVWKYGFPDAMSSFMKICQFEYGYLIAAGQVHLSPDDDDIFMCKIALPEATGIDEGNANVFIIYPNPVSNSLNIQTDNPHKTEYFIYDLSGRLLQNGSFSQSKMIDLKNLVKGVYFVQLQMPEGLVSKKFVKQ